MASDNRERPNLKICIDNSDAESESEASSSDGEDMVIRMHFGDSSSDEDERDHVREKEQKIRREAFVRVTARATKKRGKGWLLSHAVPFKQSHKTKIEYKKLEKHARRKSHEKKKKKRTPSPSSEREDDAEEDIDLTGMYKSLGIPVDENGPAITDFQLNIIHVRGIRGMSNKEIMKYFREFEPTSVEKIDSSTCNVIWPDASSAGKALMKLSINHTTDNAKVSPRKKTKPKHQKKKEKKRKPSPAKESEDDDELNLMSEDEVEKEAETNSKDKESSKEDDDTDSDEDSDCSEDSTEVSSGTWRIGKEPGSNNHVLYMRFAPKLISAAPTEVPKEANEKVERMEEAVESKQKPEDEAKSTRKRKKSNASMDYEEGEVTDSSDSGAERMDVAGIIQPPRNVIPKETAFDRHMAVQDVRISVKKRLRRFSGDDDGRGHAAESHDIVDIDELLAPPKVKRTMRMHADDEEQEVQSKRMRLEAVRLLQKKTRQPSPPRDIRSRLQLNRRRSKERPSIEDRLEPRYDEPDLWQDEQPLHRNVPDFRDISSSDDYTRNRIAAPVGKEDMWRERREPLALDPRAYQKQNGVWNRNPDWDQDRYKDLDGPQDDDDLFSVSTPVEEFGVIADNIEKSMKDEALRIKSKKLLKEKEKENKLDKEEKMEVEKDIVQKVENKTTVREKQEEDDDLFDLNSEDEEDKESSRPRKDWKLKSDSKKEESDLRSKLQSRDEARW